MKQRATWVSHPSEYAHQQIVDAQQVGQPALRTAIERQSVEQVHDQIQMDSSEAYGVPRVEWLCRVTWWCYGRPDPADPKEWTAIVQAHTGTDHFGNPAAIISDHYIEVPHRDH